jgi:hypothetical protein
MDIQSIAPSQVVKAYVGKIGCMCGCKGKYYGHAEGIEIDRADPKMVAKILRTIQANEEAVEVDDGILAYEAKGKSWVVYLSA